MLIARLAAERCCYEPECTRCHLGAASLPGCPPGRADHRGNRSRVADTGPARVCLAGRARRSGQPFRSKTWCASLAVVLERRAGVIHDSCAAGAWRSSRPPCGVDFPAGTESAPPCGSSARCHLASHRCAGASGSGPGRLAAHYPAVGRHRSTHGRCPRLGLTTLVTSIVGLTPVGGQACRFVPTQNSSGQYQGNSGVSGRGRPALWLAA